MAVYAWTPTFFDGRNLAGDPFESVRFDADAGPAQTRPVSPVEATLPGVGDRNVDVQPHGVEWILNIWLATTTVAAYETLKETFSEEKKMIYLQAVDGDGVTWFVALHLETLNRIEAAFFQAHVRVPDPTWRKLTATTTTGDFNAMSGDDETQVVANAGNRNARPLIRYEPIALRSTNPADRFQILLPGHVGTRAPLPWDRCPVNVTDSDNDPTAVIDTATLVEDQTVSHDIDEDPDGIDDAVTTWEVDGAVGGGLDAAGFAKIGSEQVYYEFAGTTISNAIRGIGGTAAAAHNDNTKMYKSSILADGSDIRVFVNGVEVKRWLGNFDDANTRIWINLTAPPAVILPLAKTIDADDTEIEFTREPDLLPDAGPIWIQKEVIYYTAVDRANRKITGCIRGCWFSTAAGHTAGQWAATRLDFLMVIAMGRYGLGPAPDLIDYRPCLQLKSSHNGQWFYGDNADDPDTAVWDPDHPNRSGMWQPDYEVDADDHDDAVALLLDESETKAAWKDSAQTAGKQQVRRLTLAIPAGIDTNGNAIVYDVQQNRQMRMRIFGRDIHGQEVEIADNWAVGGAEIAGADAAVALLYELTLNAVRAWTLGEIPAQVSETIINAVGARCQKFVLDHETTIHALLLYLKETGTPDFVFHVAIREYDATNMMAGRKVWQPDTGPTGPAGLTSSYVWYAYTDGGGDITLPAGTYVVAIYVTGWTSGGLGFRYLDTIHTRHNRFQTVLESGPPPPDTPTDFVNTLEFGLIHTGGGPVQPESAVTNQDSEGNFHDVELSLYDSSQYVRQIAHAHQPGTPDATVYHCEGRLTNQTTGDYIDVSLWLKVGEKFEIDCEARTVIVTEGSRTYDCPVGITPSNLTDWLNLQPGNNTLKWEEAGMVDSDITVIHRETSA